MALFHIELTVLAIETYAFFMPTPIAERFLASYHRSIAKQHTDRSNQFYQRSRQRYEHALPTNALKSNAFLPHIAYYYECGHGTNVNYKTAARWYKQVLTIPDSLDSLTRAQSHAGLMRIHEAEFMPSPPLPCPYPTPYQLFMQMLE